MATWTPWGKPQQSIKIVPGITWYSTAGHGGYHVSKRKLSQMPEKFANFKPFAGEGWFEEDVDWIVVMLSFPHEFVYHLKSEVDYIEKKACAENLLNAMWQYFEKRGVKFNE